MFICIQNVNFMSNFFSEILWRLCKLAILRTLGILDHLHQNHSINLKQIFMLIYMQKINCITHYFLKMLQRNLLFWLIWHAWPHTPKMIVSLWRNLQRLSSGKKSTSSFTLSLTYCKDFVNLLFGYFGHVLLCIPKVILSSCRKSLCLSASKKSTSSPMLLWRYSKDVKTYFGYFGDAWSHSPKMIVSTCRRLRCLLQFLQKINFIIHFFLKILQFKESCKMIGW